MGLKRLLQTPSGTLRAVFDGDAGLGQGVANLIGLGEILGLASFGTGVELFGDQCLQRCMLGRLGRAISGTAGSAGGHLISASGSGPGVEHGTHGEQRLTHLGLGGFGIGAVSQL